MANSDFRTFVEDRLAALVPGIDLSAGSPAQVQFIDPVIARLGKDPFETDIESFLTDRFTQEFPDIYAANAGAVRDAFIKPLILMLEPFKRETESFKRNQSFKDPSLLSDDDADALAANVFAERDAGRKSGGVARAYYPNPTTVMVNLSNRFYTSEGLSFYPTTPMTISAEEMTFNREGLFFFMDVPLVAEKAGAEYNIGENSIIGVDGLYNAIKVDNLRSFSDGAPLVDTATFVASAKESLTEQSLVSRRGANARLKSVFRGELRAVQVIGANDPEMQRDILVGDAPGQVWATGKVSLFNNIAVLQARSLQGEIQNPGVGEIVYIYLDKYANSGAWALLPESDRTIRLRIEEVMIPAFPISDPTTSHFVAGFVVRWSDPDGKFLESIPPFSVFEGGFMRKGTLHVGSLPSVGKVDLEVASGEVHVFGHTDIYVRPVLQPTSKVVLSNLSDDPTISGFSLQRTTLRTEALSNTVQDLAGFSFRDEGVSSGDQITLETGDDVGTYTIGEVQGNVLRLTSNMTKTSPGNVIRYRITKSLAINPFEPRVLKMPFGDMACNDLRTSIGSDTLEFLGTTTDLLEYGAAVGDVVRILNNTDAGDYTIKAFQSGKRVQVDRPLAATNSGLRYEVFTSLPKVGRPLVRVKDIALLDSSKKSTGFSVPYAEPLAIVPTSDFTSAQVRGVSQIKSGFILPDLTGLVSGPSVNATSGDRRYSMGFDAHEGGTWRAVKSGTLNSQSELLFPPDAFGKCSYFVSVCEDNGKAENFPPIDPRPGDALTLKSGPNKGSYLIKKVRKFKYLTANDRTSWVYFIQIFGAFPVDAIKGLYTFLTENGHPPATIGTVPPTPNPLQFPGFFTDIYNGLTTLLQSALTDLGQPVPDLEAARYAVDSLCMTDYEWGTPARGVLRSYFGSPTLMQQHTAEHERPTVFSFINETGGVVKFRADPDRYAKHEIIPARLSEDSDPLDYPRDVGAGGANLSNPDPTIADFLDSTKTSVFVAGVQKDDVLSVHEEVLFHGSTGRFHVAALDRDRMTAVSTVAGSSTVRAPETASGSIFTKEMVGDLLFIDEGDDLGGYRVTSVPDAKSLVLDRPLRRTTPAILLQGEGADWGKDNTANILQVSAAGTFSDALHKNKFVTIYGIWSDYQGSYKILGVRPGTNGRIIELDRSAITDFPAGLVNGPARWVITEAPASVPETNTSGKGTTMFGLQPIRMYNEIPSDFPVVFVTPSPAESKVIVTGSLHGGVEQPYRIYRKNLRRVNPTEMASKTDGPFFYFDTQVVSLAPGEASNISQDSYLSMDPGTYESEGYRHIVDDYTLSYSLQETGTLEIPTKLLPQDSPDSLDSYLNLVGAPVEITYERADAVQQVQEFLSSVEDRVTTANMLARHFLPAFVSYDATYYGGSSSSVVAADISSYIDNLSVETPIDVSVIEDLISDRGGNPITPTKVFTVIHDWDRKVWLEFSENEIGGHATKVPYHGTPRVSFFIPGPDVSGKNEKPLGERINLTRE